MRVAGSPINEPKYITLDQRDYDRIRDRLLHAEEAVDAASARITALEESNRRLNAQMLMLMQGVKERLDVYGVLLSRLESTVAGKDV